MAVILVDGFDLYNGVVANTGVQAKWAPNFTTTGLSMQTGRFGGQCVQWIEANSSGHGPGIRSLPANYTSVGVGFAFRLTAATGATSVNPFVEFMSGVNFQLGMAVRSNGQLDFYRLTTVAAGTLLGSSVGGVIALNTWHFIEIGVVISDTVGTVTVKVDGVAVITLTGQDTNNTGGNVNGISFQTSGTTTTPLGTYQIDDLYVVDSDTTLGVRRIKTLYPSADSLQGFSRSSGAANFSLVNETLVDGDTSYVQGALGALDRYDFDNLGLNPSSIDAVQAVAFAESTDAFARQIALQLKSGATVSDGSGLALSSSSYGRLERLTTADPAGGSWTASAVDALQGGPKVTQ